MLSKDIHNTLNIKVSRATVNPGESLVFFQISSKILTTGNIKYLNLGGCLARLAQRIVATLKWETMH